MIYYESNHNEKFGVPMQRILPVIAAQAPPRLIGEPLENFATEVREAISHQPDAKLVIFPELHLFGDGSPDQQRTNALQGAAEALDGPRVEGLRKLVQRYIDEAQRAEDKREQKLLDELSQRLPRHEPL